MHSEWKARIRHWIRTLKDDFYTPLGEIGWEAFPTMAHLRPEEIGGEEFIPVSPGFTWGKTCEYCWFRGEITLPPEAAGKRIVMNLAPGGESTLFVNGRAFGTYRASWVNAPHHYLVDNTLCADAKGGEHYEILMETYAGHYMPEAPTGGCATGPVLPGAYEDTAVEGERRVLGKCTCGIWNEDAYQLFLDVDTLDKLLQTLDGRSLRAAKIAGALEQFTLTVDFEQDRESRIHSYRAARAALRPALDAVNGSTMPVFYAVGNAHLDLAWLWPMAETHRKTARTFAAQLRLLEEYPEYRYLQSQPAAYEMCREHYPELFARILDAIGRGQWIAEGGMWVEPDTNMAGGEALIRQLMYGKKYFREVLGVESQVLWLPDTFGYSAALPQILKGCGMKYLVTQKIFWSYNEGEQFPYHYFTWEGMDGSRIVSFLPTSYTYRTDPEEINRVWADRTQERDLEAFLLPFGYGDGGGGPARDHIEYALRQKDLEGSARVKLAGPNEFFEEQLERGEPADTYVGELYFSAHRGTYTSQARIKKNNRVCELALRELEMWSSVNVWSGGAYDAALTEKLWKVLLLHQFHDILPGSSIARVNREAVETIDGVIASVRELTGLALQGLLEEAGDGAVTVWNSLGFARKALVALPERFAAGARLGGRNVPVQKIGAEYKALVSIPACGAVALVPDRAKEPVENGAGVERIADGYRLWNGKIVVKLNAKGEVVSFVRRDSGREFAAAEMNRFHLYKDVPRLFDAWDIDSNYRDQEVEALQDARMEILSDGGLEAVLKLEGRVSQSSIVQYIRLAKDSERIEFETTIDWRELHRLLKTAFPVDIYAENGMNEIQFGFVTRPTHRSKAYDKDRFEVCNHRYSALADNAHGAAVLNDCKYGISMNKNVLELTLLRAAACPEMRADNGLHHFRYAFTAWEGSFADCDVVRQGYELNVRPLVADGRMRNPSGRPDAFGILEIEKENVMLETVKPAEDGSGDIILRLYEAKKAAVCTEFIWKAGIGKAYICDMLERKEAEIPVEGEKLHLSFRPFEVKTIRISQEKSPEKYS